MQTVLLDLGEVVFNLTEKENSKINWNIISKLNKKYSSRLNLGKDLFDDFMQEYNMETNQDLSGDEFLKSIFDTLEFNKELIDFLKGKFNIVILSDNYKENVEYISKRYNISNWAKKTILFI